QVVLASRDGEPPALDIRLPRTTVAALLQRGSLPVQLTLGEHSAVRVRAELQRVRAPRARPVLPATGQRVLEAGPRATGARPSPPGGAALRSRLRGRGGAPHIPVPVTATDRAGNVTVETASDRPRLGTAPQRGAVPGPAARSGAPARA